MCGIVGVAGLITAVEQKVFKDLLRIDTIRGKHSVGIAYSEKFTGNVNVYKEVWGVDDFLDKREVVEQFRTAANCIIGHNRHATVGKVNKANAHPFEFDNVIGVHNGTLRQRYLLDNHKDFNVDSENLYHHLNRHGLQNTVDNMTGAWSLAYLDSLDGTLNLYRNDERPMSYCFSKDEKTLFFASEPYMLHLALSRHGIQYGQVYYTGVDTLNKFVLPVVAGKDIEYLPTEKVVKTPPVKKLEDKSTSSGTSSSTDYGAYPANLTNKRIAFEVVKDMQGYLHCVTAFNGDDKPVEVRVYCSNKNNRDLWEWLSTSIHMFTGVVKKYSWTEKYLLIDMRTIKETASGSYTGTPAQKDHRDNPITQEELTEQYGDCAWCSDKLVVGEALCTQAGIAFCKDCVESFNDDISPYIN